MKHRRRSQRGAALFIVVLVITLLTGLGIFAVRSASQVNTAAGHARQGTQALYFTEMGMELALAQIDGPQAAVYVNLMHTSQDATNAIEGHHTECIVNQESTENAPTCYRILDTDINERVMREMSGVPLLEEQTSEHFGSFGPSLPDARPDDTTNVGREGVFVVELTDPFVGKPAHGYNIDDPVFQPVKLSVTALGQIRTIPTDFDPDTGLRWCGNDVSARTATTMTVHVYFTSMVPR